MPIQVASFLVPRGTATYFILEDKYVRGGLRTVVDAAERDSIPVDHRKPGMIVVTQDDKKLWMLDGDKVTWSEFKGGGGGDGAGPRQTVVHSVAGIPGNSYADFSLDLGNTALVYKLSANVPCTVEVHSTPERVDTNPFRFIATEDHLEDDGSGELDDGTIVRNRRYSIWANLEDEPSGNIYFRVLNTDADMRDVTLTILFKPIEL